MRHFLIASLAAVFLIPGTASLLVAQTPDSAEVMFEAARQMELLDGDLDAAIAQYEAIVSRYPDRRTVVAEALLRMGNGYEKLGQARAREVYERLVRDYADQTAVLALAREGLSRLTVEPAPSPTMTVRELMRSGERRPGEVSEPTNGPNFAISGDGQLFVYTDWRTGDLAMKNMTTGEARSVYGTDWSGDEWFGSPVLSPDETRVAFVRYPNRTGGTTRVEVDSLEGGYRETVLDFKELANVFTHDWSPDGENLLITSEAADRSVFLATVSLEDKTLQRLVTLDWGHPGRAQYSPDGRFIAYDSTKGGDSKIYLISADGAQERVLVDSSGDDDQPLWTRDGRFLLFRSDRSGKSDLYALRMQNGEPAGQEVVVKSNLGAATQLRGVTTEQQLFVFELVGGRDIGITERIDRTATTVHVRVLPKVQTIENQSPSFAPDGERLAYLAGTPMSRFTIRVTNLEGKVLKDIPLDRRFSTIDPPRFSPDGKMMALRVYDAGEAEIMVLSAEVGTVLKVFSPVEEKGYARVLGWSRDSRLLYAFVTLEAGDRSLAAIDVDTEQIVESTVLSDNVSRVRLSPSGDYLLMLVRPPQAGQGLTTQLVLHSLEDGSEKLLREGISIRFGWDFDSRHVWYRKMERGEKGPVSSPELYRFSLDTEEETVLVEDMKELDLVTVSPDGKYWALQNGDQDRDSRIWVLENFLPESPAGDDQTAGR